MAQGESRSFIISVSKPKKYLFKSEELLNLKNNNNNPLKPLFQKRPTASSFRKYDLPKQELLPVHKLKETHLLLPLKLFLKKQDHKRFKKYIKISIYDKHKIFRPRLKEYLKVDKVSNDVRTITDVDEDFFLYVNGRPTFSHVPIFKTLKIILNDLLRIRHEIGNKKDCIFNIEVNGRHEKKIYDLISKQFSQQASYLDKFISQDYHNSMLLLSKWEKLEQKVELQIAELQSLANEMFNVQSRIIGLDYKYSQQQKFGRFLYYLSPPTWRLYNREFARSVEIEAKGFDFGDSRDDDTFNVVFEKLRNIVYGKPIKPVLYFSRPEDLIEVFNTMEYQQLHYFTHVTHLTPYINHLRESIKAMKSMNAQDSALVLNSIQKFENLLSFSDKLNKHLKSKFYKILFGTLYDCVGQLDVLKLRLHLEFCFEKVILDKPINMNLICIARNLENHYMEFTKRLDNIQSTHLRQAVAKYHQLENQKFVRANRAAKELRLFYRLEKQLLRAHGFHSNCTETPFKCKKFPRYKQNDCSKASLVVENRQRITAAEKEYLTLFTDWTENEDPANYLQRLSLKDNVEKIVSTA